MNLCHLAARFFRQVMQAADGQTNMLTLFCIFSSSLRVDETARRENLGVGGASEGWQRFGCIKQASVGALNAAAIPAEKPRSAEDLIAKRTESWRDSNAQLEPGLCLLRNKGRWAFRRRLNIQPRDADYFLNLLEPLHTSGPTILDA